MCSFRASYDLFFAAMFDSPPSNFSLKFWLSCMILVCCVWDLFKRDFLEGFMAAIWVNTSEEKSLKNSSLKHLNHDLGKTPSSYRFWWISWSIHVLFVETGWLYPWDAQAHLWLSSHRIWWTYVQISSLISVCDCFWAVFGITGSSCGFLKWPPDHPMHCTFK